MIANQFLVITLFRVFTNQETTEGYYLLFKRVFTLIKRITGQSVQFNSMHSSGICGIIIDMDAKQYIGKYLYLLSKQLIIIYNFLGLGQYLREIDPQHRPLPWQLKGIIIFCRVHFFRTITNIVEKNTGIWSRMVSLIDCKSEDDYDQLCDLLIRK